MKKINAILVSLCIILILLILNINNIVKHTNIRQICIAILAFLALVTVFLNLFIRIKQNKTK